MRKGLIYLGVLLALASVGAGIYYLYAEYQEEQELRQQLVDVNRKIDQLPELEEDIFTKCMEGKSGTATELRTCQESTQKAIFTLSQDLTNLKTNVESKL